MRRHMYPALLTYCNLTVTLLCTSTALYNRGEKWAARLVDFWASNKTLGHTITWGVSSYLTSSSSKGSQDYSAPYWLDWDIFMAIEKKRQTCSDSFNSRCWCSASFWSTHQYTPYQATNTTNIMGKQIAKNSCNACHWNTFRLCPSSPVLKLTISVLMIV